jgi:hypothetical protein
MNDPTQQISKVTRWWALSARRPALDSESDRSELLDETVMSDTLVGD